MGGLVAASLNAPTPKTNPLVTVIIPTYNWSSVLQYAIASVLRQTYRHFELLVVGDCCTDDSEEVVASFRDERVHWHNLQTNSGSQSAPNNAGIERARGELVAYLGHDDLWAPSHLARLVAALEGSQAVGAYAATLGLGPPGSHVRVLGGLRAWSEELWVPPTSLAHRRDAVEEVGSWHDYRTLVEPPDSEFVTRLAGARGGLLPVHALTACKFHSMWRRNSYVLRRSEEQAAYFPRIEHEFRFVSRELAVYVWDRLGRRGNLPPASLEPAPEVIPPGWRVAQWRKIRGLPEHPEG